MDGAGATVVGWRGEAFFGMVISWVLGRNLRLRRYGRRFEGGPRVFRFASKTFTYPPPVRGIGGRLFVSTTPPAAVEIGLC
jgi:hypothetical protein